MNHQQIKAVQLHISRILFVETLSLSMRSDNNPTVLLCAFYLLFSVIPGNCRQNFSIRPVHPNPNLNRASTFALFSKIRAQNNDEIAENR